MKEKREGAGKAGQLGRAWRAIRPPKSDSGWKEEKLMGGNFLDCPAILGRFSFTMQCGYSSPSQLSVMSGFSRKRLALVLPQAHSRTVSLYEMCVLTSYEVIDCQQQFGALSEFYSLKEKVSEAQCHGPEMLLQELKN